MRPRAGGFRHWLVWTGKVVLAAVLLLLLLRNVHSDILLATLNGARPLMVAAAVLLLLPNLLLQYGKWALLLRSAYPAVAARDIRASLMLGFTFGIVTPARIGEFGGRAAAVRGADRMTLVGLTAADKLATLTITVLAGGVGLLLFCIRHPFIDPFILAGMEMTVAAVTATVLHFGYRRMRQSRTPVSSGWFAGRLYRIRTSLEAVDTRVRRRLLLLSVLFYSTFLLQFVILLAAFGPVDMFSAIAGVSTIMLIKTVIPPVTIGELGIREGASVYVLGHAGILAAAAFSASLLLFAINILLPSLAGLAILFRRSSPAPVA